MIRILLITAVLLGPAGPSPAQDLDRAGYQASYTLTFESDWSAATHPEAFPSNPHFSALIGGTHNERGHLWRDGVAASRGIESMAETGSTFRLRQEVEDLAAAGIAEFVVDGPGISRSPGEAVTQFSITQAFPLLSITSMLAPSPDWFVGTDSLSLRQDGQWLDEMVVELQVMDAGSDSGSEYTSANADTAPRQAVHPLVVGPFSASGVIGRLVFRLDDAGGDFPFAGHQSGLYFDPERDGEGMQITIAQIEDRRVFSVTWYTYDSGQQLWLVGNADLEPGADTVTIELLQTEGANFGAGFRPEDVQIVPWGIATFRVPACGSLTVDYNGGTTRIGQLDLQQLVPIEGLKCL